MFLSIALYCMLFVVSCFIGENETSGERFCSEEKQKSTIPIRGLEPRDPA